MQQYHRGFETTAFDVTISHPLQKKYLTVAMDEEAHDRKLKKYLKECREEGIHLVPLAWETLGGATDTVHSTVRKMTDLEASRGGYSAPVIRRNLYAQLSCCLQRHLAQAVIDRRLELSCDLAL